MSRNTDVDTRIRRMCMLAGTDEEKMNRLGTDLLETFRDVCRCNTGALFDTVSGLCGYGGDYCESETEEQRIREAVIRLEFFAAEMDRRRYEDAIDEILHTDWMIRVMEILKMKVYTFADFGQEFVEILNLCYMNAFDYSEGDIPEMLNMGRSTYYKKKKRAVTLFGLAFYGFKTGFGAEAPVTREPAVGEQIRMAL